MPIKLALQLAYRAAQFGTRQIDSRHGSDQILGSHLVDILRREQGDLRSALAADESTESRRGAASDALQILFCQRVSHGL